MRGGSTRFRGGSAGFHGGSAAFRGGSVAGFRGASVYRGSLGFRGGVRGRYGYRGFYGYYGWPYYYPGLYAGYYDPSFDSGYYDPYYNGYSSDTGDAGYAYAPPAPDPPVIVQQPPPAPALREYPAPTPPAQAPQAQNYQEPLYLLAMHDGTIRAVLSYSADGASLRYVTLDHEQKQVPLSSIDRSLSERLNRERNVSFRLPG
jgi:hypothetical protein